MTAICDTEPLVAYLNRHDPYHSWAVAVMKQVRPPMLTCEPVLTEAACFLREDGVDVDPLFRLLERDALRLNFDVSTHWPRIRTLMARLQADGFGVCVDCRHERAARKFRGSHDRSKGFQHIQMQRSADNRFRGAAQTLIVPTLPMLEFTLPS